MEQNTTPSKPGVIKNLYFYLVTFVALMMVVFSTADLINTALKTWVFTKADSNPYSYDYPCDVAVPAVPEKIPSQISPEQCEKQKETARKNEAENRAVQKQRDVVRDISFIAVGVPLFLFHWRFIRRKLDV